LDRKNFKIETAKQTTLITKLPLIINYVNRQKAENIVVYVQSTNHRSNEMDNIFGPPLLEERDQATREQIMQGLHYGIKYCSMRKKSRNQELENLKTILSEFENNPLMVDIPLSRFFFLCPHSGDYAHVTLSEILAHGSDKIKLYCKKRGVPFLHTFTAMMAEPI
jgi:hypothetical protein